MAQETNFWQQIFNQDKEWNTGAVLGTALQVPGEAMDSLDRAFHIPGTKWSVYNARHAIIDPAVQQASKLHPAAGVATNIGLEMLIPDSTLYFGKLVKGAGKISKAFKGADLAFETAGAASKTSKGGNVLQAVSDTTKQTEPYIKWRARGELHGNAAKKAGKGQPMKGFEHFTAPDGQVYRLGSETSTKTGKTKYVVIGVEGRKVRDLTRAEAVKLDDDTLLRQFGGDKKLFKSYKSTNKKVIKEIRERISKLNAENVDTPGWVDWQVEHIFDAQFYSKLGKLLPNFSGRGADELGNLMLIRKTANASSGAKAMNIDPGDALVDAIKKNQLVDYAQTTEDFMAFDLGETVKNMKPKDWDRFFKQAIENPKTNFNELLKNF